jgi:hypothetical protein
VVISVTKIQSEGTTMTPLRQRFIEDMQLRGLAPTTQRSYLHYVSEFAKFYKTSPEHLDLEAVRQNELYLLHQRKAVAGKHQHLRFRRAVPVSGHAGNALGQRVLSPRQRLVHRTVSSLSRPPASHPLFSAFLGRETDETFISPTEKISPEASPYQ